MSKPNDSPWFVGQGCKVPGSSFEWVVLVLAGNYALVGNIYQPGGNVRLLAVGMLERPAEQVKATPGQLYRHQETDQLGVGTKDGCIFDSDSRLIWAFDNHAWQVESDGKR